MKKVSLLLGALGGALGGYLLSNAKLREGLAETKNAEEAARLLGKHLQQDGKKLAKDVKNFIESQEVQQNVAKARKFAVKKAVEARHTIEAFMKRNEQKAMKAAKHGVKSAKIAVRRAGTRVKTGFRSEEVS